ncbi:hypothetical protein jhhlp_007242 [Lomentospora prolificans]|uniref:RRM domain-containing protein n=1 Tax=Lomentospora prolificans TaxID=41688 RepID=A0A2N3N243_9PEZI|nr:hypothetical protein jhhlp_007242 [Lomentospora prolificans]
MSYPPPPGITGSNQPPGASSSHPSLPARPPVPKPSSGFKPAFGSSNKPSSYSSSTSYAPGNAPGTSTSQYGPSYQGYPSTSSVSAAPYQAQAQAYQYPQSNYQSSAYGSTAGVAAYSAPQIRNPFPAPNSGNDSYDAEMAAQYAQWQSAYVSKDATAGKDAAGAGGFHRGTSTATSANAIPVANTPTAEAATEPPERKKTVVREGGGKKWTDDTLLEWDPSHPRLFVGNLAGEVTDDSLLKAFSRWKSVQKARVIRDKRTSKSKNYGFVSFSDPDDYFQAAKEMNGKYIQSHPVIVTRAKTEIKPTSVKEKDKGKRNKKGYKNNNGQNHPSFEPNLGPRAGGGVHKPGQKMKNGLKLLG